VQSLDNCWGELAFDFEQAADFFQLLDEADEVVLGVDPEFYDALEVGSVAFDADGADVFSFLDGDDFDDIEEHAWAVFAFEAEGGEELFGGGWGPAEWADL